MVCVLPIHEVNTKLSIKNYIRLLWENRANRIFLFFRLLRGRAGLVLADQGKDSACFYHSPRLQTAFTPSSRGWILI